MRRWRPPTIHPSTLDPNGTQVSGHNGRNLHVFLQPAKKKEDNKAKSEQKPINPAALMSVQDVKLRLQHLN